MPLHRALTDAESDDLHLLHRLLKVSNKTRIIAALHPLSPPSPARKVMVESMDLKKYHPEILDRYFQYPQSCATENRRVRLRDVSEPLHCH